jgi:hypothetical protein
MREPVRRIMKEFGALRRVVFKSRKIRTDDIVE